jgi:glycosyltransferase involved in cell wall biosynthesis
MKILELAAWEEPVPPVKYGGTELVVYSITEDLVKQGHEVYLFGTGDSKTSAHLIPIVEKSLRVLYPTSELNALDVDVRRAYMKISKIPEMLARINEIKPDIIHNHSNWRVLLFKDFIACPIVTTIHGPLTSYSERETYSKIPEGNYVSISDNQRKALPEMNWVKTIYNGIDVSRFDLGKGQGDYFVFLGRISPEKGVKEICTMIRKTSFKLKIAAKIDQSDLNYYEKEVKPLIDGTQIQFLGEIGHEEKNTLLGGAKALLLWLNWEEPFGLVVTEAMACGTPVIVNRRGSMPELILDTKTGFLVETQDEMIKKMSKIETLDRTTCRMHVKDKFSMKKMAQEYLALFQNLL